MDADLVFALYRFAVSHCKADSTTLSDRTQGFGAIKVGKNPKNKGSVSIYAGFSTEKVTRLKGSKT